LATECHLGRAEKVYHVVFALVYSVVYGGSSSSLSIWAGVYLGFRACRVCLGIS
jgi:hypothetical protein